MITLESKGGDLMGFVLLDVTMADFITAVTSWFTAAIGWVSSVGTTIMGSPILLAFCSLPIPSRGTWRRSVQKTY